MREEKFSQRIAETLHTYDRETILRAYKEHINGAGANTVGQIHGKFSPYSHGDLTVIGDRLIDTGRWLCQKEGIDIHTKYITGLVHSCDEFKCCTFHGSWGEIKVYIPTGEVVEVLHEGYGRYEGVDSFGGYHHIKQVDIKEFKEWLREVPSPGGKGHYVDHRFSWDILDVGFWTVWGTYEPADKDHRKLIIELSKEQSHAESL